MNQTKKSPVKARKPARGIFLYVAEGEKGGNAIRRVVNYALLLSVSAGMPEIVK